MASLNFKGKTAVWNHHLSVPYHSLDKDKKNSLEGKNSDENLIIEGDNLLALKALLPKYRGKVKCIYIDPPYNTGKEEWVYNDNVNSPLIKSWIGEVVGREGEDLVRHDKWLCMMAPRLKLMRELLSDDGVIFISIDENEIHHLRSLCDEIFHTKEHLGTIVVQTATDNNPTQLVIEHEYVLVYSKNSEYQTNWESMSFGGNLIENKYIELKGQFKDDIKSVQKELRAWMKVNGSTLKRVMHYDNVDEKGVYHDGDISNTRPGGYNFQIVHPLTGKPCAVPPNGFRFKEETLKEMVKNNDILFGRDETILIKTKIRLNSVSEKFRSIYYEDGRDSTNELAELFDGVRVFDNPKSKHLLKYFFGFIPDSNNSIFLDAFAGSGTTAQAVLELNKEMNGSRKFILIQIPEKIKSDTLAYKAGYKFVNEITRDRTSKVIKKEKISTGFTYYKLGPSIDTKYIIAGKNLPTWDNFAKYVHYLATGSPIDDIKNPGKDFEIISKSKHTGVYLIYEGDIEKLKQMAITRDWLELVKNKEGKKIVYAPACFLDKEILDEHNISFVQIPFNLFQRG